MPAPVLLDDPVETALRAARPANELRGITAALLATGSEREQLVADLNRIRCGLAERDQPAEEELIFYLLDALAGWCAPGQEL